MEHRPLTRLVWPLVLWLVAGVVHADNQDEPWPLVFDPFRVLTIHFELDPEVWEDIKRDTKFYDEELNIRAPALMWADGETNKLLVAIRRKSSTAIPSEADPQKVSLKVDIFFAAHNVDQMSA